MAFFNFPKNSYQLPSTWFELPRIEKLLENLNIEPSFFRLLNDSIKKKPYNLFLGDNLSGLHGLSHDFQEAFTFAFVDPPYNSTHDFIINDFQNENVSFWTRGTSHRKWMRMLFPRLIIIRKLLHSNSGCLMFCIDDKEFHFARLVLDKIFGEHNFLGCIIWQSLKGIKSQAFFTFNHTYLLIYAKNKINFQKQFQNNSNLAIYNTPYNFSSIWDELPTSIEAREELAKSLTGTGFDSVVQYLNPKPSLFFLKILSHLFPSTSDYQEIKILDPFAGTGSLLFALAEFNKKRSTKIHYFGCQYPLNLSFLTDKVLTNSLANLSIIDIVKYLVSFHGLELDTNLIEFGSN